MLPLVVTITGPEPAQSRTVAFSESPVFVGRGPLNELELLEPWVARTEGVLEFDDDSVRYTRQSTRNHLTVDGREVSAGGPSPVSGELVIGRLKLTLARRSVADETLFRPHAGDQDAEAPARRAETVMLGAAPDEPEPLRAGVRSAQRAPYTAEPAPGSTTAHPELGPIERSIASPIRAPSSQPREPVAPASAPPQADVAGTLELEALHEGYRRSWHALLTQLTVQLESAPDQLRARLAHDLQRSWPQITREPEFRELLKRLGLKARKPDDPDLEQWLHRIEQVLPPGVKLQSGFTMERLLEIVEGYTGAFIDMNDAQEEVRHRALGKLSRESLLQKSEDPNVVLAYLLNPEAKWSSRLAELRAVIKGMVRHEWALMQATMEGARELLESLAPVQLAGREGVELPAHAEQTEKGFWHARARDSSAARLWFRFVEEHRALSEGDHYQRIFLGARFSRRYTKAMGAPEEPVSSKR